MTIKRVQLNRFILHPLKVICLARFAFFAALSILVSLVSATSNTLETRSFTHSINERNELTFVDSDATSGANPPPAADSQTIYDQSGNLVFDGTYFYQYDAWGRLIQINTAALSSGNVNPLAPTPDPTPCPAQEFTIGSMIKHFTYDGLGRLVRVQSPWPSATTANGWPQGHKGKPIVLVDIAAASLCK